MKLNSVKDSNDVKMADFPVLVVCSVKREIVHTSHTICRLAPIDNRKYPYVAKILNLSVHR